VSGWERATMILGAGRLRDWGYPNLADALTRYALGFPDGNSHLMTELLRIGPEKWAELKARLQEAPPDQGEEVSL
jgi:hypothetical protein